MNKNYYLAIPLFINILLALFTNYWGFSGNKPYVILGSSLLLIFLFVIRRKGTSYLDKIILKLNSIEIQYFYPYCYGLIFLMFCFIPIRNLNYGDGIILFENSYLEGKIFGFQITLDEFLEGFLHSIFINAFDETRKIYRWISTLAGLLFLTFSIFIIQKEKRSNIEGLLLLTSGSTLLFFGYAENYTLVSLYLYFFLYLIYNLTKKGKDSSVIYLIALLASLGALFHLVFGYIAISLAYFAYYKSEKDKFLFNSLISILLASFLIGFVFTYFLFFSDPIASSNQTHIMSLPFYPLRKIISTNHLIEILGNLWFTNGFAVVFLSFAYLSNKNKFKEFCSLPENILIILVILGFFIHSIVFNPLLNYPTDWDLMSFYSIPLIFFCFLYYPHMENKNIILPFLLYFLGFIISTALSLSTNPPNLETSFITDMNIAKTYVEENKIKYESIHKYNKKDYLKLDYFLFKARTKLHKINHKDRDSLIKENYQYKKELDQAVENSSGRLDKLWSKNFFIKLTDYHHRYLKVLEEGKKYHPETLQTPSENQ